MSKILKLVCTYSKSREAQWPTGLKHWTLDRGVRVQALGRVNALYSWSRHISLTTPLSSQMYKWVLVNLMLGVTLRWTSIPFSVGVEYS